MTHLGMRIKGMDNPMWNFNLTQLEGFQFKKFVARGEDNCSSNDRILNPSRLFQRALARKIIVHPKFGFKKYINLNFTHWKVENLYKSLKRKAIFYIARQNYFTIHHNIYQNYFTIHHNVYQTKHLGIQTFSNSPRIRIKAIKATQKLA